MKSTMDEENYALEMKDLSVSFDTVRGEIQAVQNLSLSIRY